MSLSWQGSLFDAPEPEGGTGLSFDGLVRHRLDDRSWLDEVTGWALDHAAVSELLLAEAPWRQRQTAHV